MSNVESNAKIREAKEGTRDVIELMRKAIAENGQQAIFEIATLSYAQGMKNGYSMAKSETMVV